jgi:signal transduction histidine kinase
MAHDLAPVRIERGSLADALQRMIESTAEQLAIAVSCECLLDGSAISDVAADQLYLFCRDALIEAALIEHCRRICIQLRSHEDSLVIRVSGHGQGPITHISRHESHTRMIVFRARLLGGSLGFGPEGDAEFCITLTIPSCRIQDHAVSDAAPALMQL